MLVLLESDQCVPPLPSPALRMAFLLLLLISATWLLGLMAVNSDVMTFHYLFAVFSCLQVAQRIVFVSEASSFTLPVCNESDSAFFTGSLHLLLPCDLQQRSEEEPQECLHGEEEHTRRIQHHEGLSAHSE